MPTVMWFRRDLRFSDNPAVLDAAARRHHLSESLCDLDHAEERRDALDRDDGIKR